jgi:hypothetical protein
VKAGDVADHLASPVTARYDTIFLDIWETLNAAHLPMINRMRDLALRHLAPDGRVLLWGYRWMVRLFEDACRQLLAVAPAERRSWLAAQAKASPQAVALLKPMVDHFQGRVVENEQSALAWCRRYIVQQRDSADD